MDRLLGGDVRALARTISAVENGSRHIPEILKRVYPSTGRARVVGVTGPPGAGKSSLVNELAAVYRDRGESVGIIAVDPSSAFSGGAILGDRIRMQRHALDPGVFIRSMANRGHPGGLARATHDAVDLLDAAGYSVILVETVGVGQDEIEVVRAAGTVVVVLVPGLGDDIQSIKAGIMEIAHIFVINKADREGADRVQMEIRQMLALAESATAPRPPIVRTVAIRGEGLVELAAQIEAHQQGSGGEEATTARRTELSRARFMTLLQAGLLESLERRVGAATIEAAVTAIAERRTDPYSATTALLSQAGLGDQP